MHSGVRLLGQLELIEEPRMWRSVACLAFMLSGCAPATVPPAGTSLPAWTDEMEYYVPTNRGMLSRGQAAATGMTHYFHISTRRVCYSFQVPGTWEAGRESGVVRRLDGKGLVGVLLLSVADLGGGSVEDAIRKAAERSDELYAKERGHVPSTLTPYPSVPGAWHWTLAAEGTVSDRPGSVARIVPRWYLPVGDAWIAQFTIGAPPDVDGDAFVTGLLTSLTTSREPRCYEARLRELGGIR